MDPFNINIFELSSYNINYFKRKVIGVIFKFHLRETARCNMFGMLLYCLVIRTVLA